MLNKIIESIPGVFTVVVLLALFIGWRLRRYDLITPGHGWGFLFGVCGTALMLALMIYPFRKRVRGVEAIGNVKAWFRIHMVLGILGPVLILFHANFHYGAMNSNVALFCMLVVSSSGVIGRYFYGKIHYGLYGEKASLNDLKQKLLEQKEQVHGQNEIPVKIKEKLALFADETLAQTEGFWHSFARLFKARFQAMGLFTDILLLNRSHMDSPSRHYAVDFIKQTLKVSEFNFYERLFSLWHMLHLPLVFILAFAVVFHVIAVYKY